MGGVDTATQHGVLRLVDPAIVDVEIVILGLRRSDDRIDRTRHHRVADVDDDGRSVARDRGDRNPAADVAVTSLVPCQFRHDERIDGACAAHTAPSDARHGASQHRC